MSFTNNTHSIETLNLKRKKILQKMPLFHTTPFMENPALLSLLHHRTTTSTTLGPTAKKPSKTKGSGGGGGLFRMFKLLPMLTTGCKMVALLGGRKLLTDKATTVTLFGFRKGRLTLAIQEDPHRLPIFVIELPMLTSVFHKEMASDTLRIALECDTRAHKKKVLEEYVWAVYCNGRKIGYSIRRKDMIDDELYVMRMLRGVSMGAGVLPSPTPEKEKETTATGDAYGELAYIRARFDRVVGSKDSESFYMINPDHGASSGQELRIYFVRIR